jgi:hypothetical protein
VLKAVFIHVDPSTDGPNQFQTVQKTRECLFNRLQRALQITELAVKCQQELDEVLSLCMFSSKVNILRVEVLQNYGILMSVMGCQNIKDSFDLLFVKLLVKCVELCSSICPVVLLG